MDFATTYPALEAQEFDFTVINQALAKLDELASKVVDLEKHMQQVRDQGIAEAKPHWRNGRYLYLIYPQKNGQRKREYIGANESKQQVALCQVANFELYHELESKHRQAQNNYHALRHDFTYTLQRIAGGRRW